MKKKSGRDGKPGIGTYGNEIKIKLIGGAAA